MILMRHLRGVGAFGLGAVAAVVGPGAGVATAGGHGKVVYYYSGPVQPVVTSTTMVPMTAVPVTTGHGFHHKTSVGAVMMVPAATGWTGQPGMAVSPSGFGATPLYGFGAVPMATSAPAYGFGVSGYSASPTYTYYYPTAATAAPNTSSSGTGFGTTRTGVSADITALASNPKYQALAAYMGNDITRVQALRSSLLDQFKKIIQQNNGNLPPQNWLESLLMNAAQDFLNFTPYGPLFNQLQPLLQDLIGDVINQGKQTLNVPPRPPPPPGRPRRPRRRPRRARRSRSRSPAARSRGRSPRAGRRRPSPIMARRRPPRPSRASPRTTGRRPRRRRTDAASRDYLGLA
jgi:hypothetical protein